MRRPQRVNSFLSYSNAARPWPTNGRRQHRLNTRLSENVFFVRASGSAHRRPTGGAAEAALCVLALTSYFQFRRLALLPFALCLEPVAPCQLGSSILKTGAAISNAVFRRRMAHWTSPTHAVARTRRSFRKIILAFYAARPDLASAALLWRSGS